MPMGCIPAPSCKKALRDATARWPDRNRASDGICGDEAHQARKSDHNTGDAFDLTHDVDHGVNCHVLSNQVITDPRVKYVIWNARIYKSYQPEKGWQPYTGANLHKHHMHVSIYANTRDNLSAWPWSFLSVTDEPETTPTPVLKQGDRGPAVWKLQDRLIELGYHLKADGVFGKFTRAAVQLFQEEHGLEVDGKVGPVTRKALGL